MSLDLTSLKSSVKSLESSIEISKDWITGKNKNIDEVIRAGVICNFEFTYELAWKFMTRWLSINYSPSVSGIARKELFRIALEYKLIDNFDSWVEYNEARNKTSHTYDTANAEYVFNTAKKFLTDIKKFLKVLEENNK